MKRNYAGPCLIFTITTLLLLSIITLPNFEQDCVQVSPTPMVANGLTHDPIVITQNSEFTGPNGVVQGSGTKSDPWVIANWTINGQVAGPCISIQGTTDYFVIRNCTCYNGSRGIYLKDVSHASIISTNCTNNTRGIYIEDSGADWECQDIVVLANNCTNNSNEGLWIWYLANSSISGNNCSANKGSGMAIYGIQNSSISENTLSFNPNGVKIFTGGNSTFSENTIFNNTINGIDCSASDCTILKNTCANNSQGMSIGMGKNCSVDQNSIVNCTYAVMVSGLTNSSFRNNNISFERALTGSVQGFNIQSNAENISIVNNTILKADFGILSYNCKNITIQQNLLKWCKSGISANTGSQQVKVTNNKVFYSTDYAIVFMSGATGGEVCYNSAIGGGISDFAGGNSFHDNYYSPSPSIPAASIEASSTSVKKDVAVQFTDTTTGGNPLMSYFWDFGDGTNSSLQNPAHAYGITGTFTVQLTVQDVDGDVSVSSDVQISVVENTTNNPDDEPTDGDDTGDENPNIPGIPLVGLLIVGVMATSFLISKYRRKSNPS